jgi:hypothetical protein
MPLGVACGAMVGKPVTILFDAILIFGFDISRACLVVDRFKMYRRFAVSIDLENKNVLIELHAVDVPWPKS